MGLCVVRVATSSRLTSAGFGNSRECGLTKLGDENSNNDDNNHDRNNNSSSGSGYRSLLEMEEEEIWQKRGRITKKK